MIDKFGIHIRNGRFIGNGIKTSRAIKHNDTTVEYYLNKHDDEIAKKSGIEQKMVVYTATNTGMQTFDLKPYMPNADIVYAIGVRQERSDTICTFANESNWLRFTAPNVANYNIMLVGVYN